MFNLSKFHKNQSGQAALEAAIILIAFVVVASVFAFAILSAGSSTTQKGESAIYSGLAEVQSSMQIKGAVIAKSTDGVVSDLLFTVSPVSGGAPVNLDDAAATRTLVISYLDATQQNPSLGFKVNWIVPSTSPSNKMLTQGNLAEIDVVVPSTLALGANTPFTLEVKPPTGGTLVINRTTPAALDAVMELR